MRQAGMASEDILPGSPRCAAPLSRWYKLRRAGNAKDRFAMENHVFAAVLMAALLHAGWNSVLRIGLDRVSTVLLLALVQAMIAIPVLPFVTQPAVEAWPWILASAALHTGYKIFLVQAYAHADL